MTVLQGTTGTPPDQASLRIGLTDYRFLGRLQHTLYAPQQVGNRPEKGGRLGMIFRVHAIAPLNTYKTVNLP